MKRQDKLNQRDMWSFALEFKIFCLENNAELKNKTRSDKLHLFLCRIPNSRLEKLRAYPE